MKLSRFQRLCDLEIVELFQLFRTDYMSYHILLQLYIII